jgi:hypothetical protein
MDLKKCENCIHIFRDSNTFKLNSKKNIRSKSTSPRTAYSYGTVRRYTLMLRWKRHAGREDNIFQF